MTTSATSRPLKLSLNMAGAGSSGTTLKIRWRRSIKSLADGCDGFEFDVRLTEDEEAVISHDPRFGKFKIERTMAQQVATLPRLRDVLKRYQANAFLDIEVKVKGLENAG